VFEGGWHSVRRVGTMCPAGQDGQGVCRVGEVCQVCQGALRVGTVERVYHSLYSLVIEQCVTVFIVYRKDSNLEHTSGRVIEYLVYMLILHAEWLCCAM
jgi:hypothetical protein